MVIKEGEIFQAFPTNKRASEIKEGIIKVLKRNLECVWKWVEVTDEQ